MIETAFHLRGSLLVNRVRKVITNQIMERQSAFPASRKRMTQFVKGVRLLFLLPVGACSFVCVTCLQISFDWLVLPAIPLAMKLVGDSPIVKGSTMTAILDVNKSIYKLRCKISRRTYRDCEST